MPLKEMRDELKQLRKSCATKPISKMKKSDIAVELEKLRGNRETTPSVDATKATPMKKMEAKISDVKVAKENGFPVAPKKGSEEMKAKMAAIRGMKGSKGSKEPAAKPREEAKMSKKDMLKKLIEEMDD